MKRATKLSVRLLAVAALALFARAMAHVTPLADGGAEAPDE